MAAPPNLRSAIEHYWTRLQKGVTYTIQFNNQEIGTGVFDREEVIGGRRMFIFKGLQGSVTQYSQQGPTPDEQMIGAGFIHNFRFISDRYSRPATGGRRKRRQTKRKLTKKRKNSRRRV